MPTAEQQQVAKVAERIKILSNTERGAIMRVLERSGAMSVAELRVHVAQELGMAKPVPQSTISNHLTKLRLIGCVEAVGHNAYAVAAEERQQLVVGFLGYMGYRGVLVGT